MQQQTHTHNKKAGNVRHSHYKQEEREARCQDKMITKYNTKKKAIYFILEICNTHLQVVVSVALAAINTSFKVNLPEFHDNSHMIQAEL